MPRVLPITISHGGRGKRWNGEDGQWNGGEAKEKDGGQMFINWEFGPIECCGGITCTIHTIHVFPDTTTSPSLEPANLQYYCTSFHKSTRLRKF